MCIKKIGKVLLAMIVIEGSLGGGGRLLNTGTVSPRMLFFGMGLVYSAVRWLRREKIPREFVFLTGLFAALSAFSCIISTLENQPVTAVLSDIKPIAYFLLLPFFALTIRSPDDVALISRIWKSSALILSISYLLTLFVWKTGLITTEQLCGWLNPAQDPGLEFYYRGGTTFFFKALLYVGVGVFFFAGEKKWIRSLALLALLLTIALTMTRGVWLSVFMVLSARAFICSKNRLNGAAWAVGFLAVGILGAILINLTLPSVAISNAVRMNDLKTLFNTVWNWQSALFGRGFGAGVLGRETIEITYVNILFKQGLSGILFWMLLPVYSLWQTYHIKNENIRTLAIPYLMATAFVYVVSLTNPFLTNPIGMSIVLISMVAVRILRYSARSEPGNGFPAAGLTGEK